MILTLDNTSKS